MENIHIFLLVAVLFLILTLFLRNNNSQKNQKTSSKFLKNIDLGIINNTLLTTDSTGNLNTVNVNEIAQKIVSMFLPRGMIMAWYPPTATIGQPLSALSPPPGWAICNGQNNTPDLRGRFILMGTQDGSKVGQGDAIFGAIGGEAEHLQKDTEVGSHKHYFSTVSKDGANGGKVRTDVVNTWAAEGHDMSDLNKEGSGGMAYPRTALISTSDRKTKQDRQTDLNGNKIGKRTHELHVGPQSLPSQMMADAVVAPMNILPPYMSLVYIMKL